VKEGLARFEGALGEWGREADAVWVFGVWDGSPIWLGLSLGLCQIHILTDNSIVLC